MVPPSRGEVFRKRGKLPPEEAAAVLDAADCLDRLHVRRFPVRLVFETLVLCGARPSAVFAARVADFDGERIRLGPGCGRKRNGPAFLPAEFAAQLRASCAGRPGGARLFPGPEGGAADKHRMPQRFAEAAALAFTRLSWPGDAGDVTTEEVAFLLGRGRPRGADGAPPRDPEKIARRRTHAEDMEAVAERVGPEVRRLMDGVSLYGLRHTFITWARARVSADVVRAAVGHAGRDIEERHYADLRLVDAREACEAVWRMLADARAEAAGGEVLRAVAVAGGGEVAPIVAPVGASARNILHGQGRKRAQVPAPQEVECGVSDGNRTRVSQIHSLVP